MHPSIDPDREWLEQADLQARSSRTLSPYEPSNGYDPLHLWYHARRPSEDEPPYPTNRFQYEHETERRATLVLDSMAGWYRALIGSAEYLAGQPGPSWTIDVVVTTVGHLGAYRYSKTTGLWYSGKHRHHLDPVAYLLRAACAGQRGRRACGCTRLRVA